MTPNEGRIGDEALTDEQIELLRRYGNRRSLLKGRIAKINGVSMASNNRRLVDAGMVDGIAYRQTAAAKTLLATIDTQREQAILQGRNERDVEVNQAAEKLLSGQDRDLIFVDNCGTELPVVLYLGRADQVAVEHDGIAAPNLTAALEAATESKGAE
jgi:hypothetical protein